MWGNAFNDDDTLDPQLADEYGIVMGTSHHEPMLRAQQEWKRYGKGEWNYEHNDSTLRAFWAAGHPQHGVAREHRHRRHARRRRHADDDRQQHRSCSSESCATSARSSTSVTKKPASATPQLWALYKEVQDYYDKGMRVPDDVTLLFSDDNWGNIRRLPSRDDTARAGGFGDLLPLRLRRRAAELQVDQHESDRARLGADAPRVRVRREPHLDRERRRPEADGIPDLVLPRLRVEPERALPAERACRSTRAAGPTQQFGSEHRTEIAEIIIDRRSDFAGRRKPELLDTAHV